MAKRTRAPRKSKDSRGRFDEATAAAFGARGGRKGGKAVTPAKLDAARANGARGGRPSAMVVAAADHATEVWRLGVGDRRMVVRVLRRGDALTTNEWDGLSATVQAACNTARMAMRAQEAAAHPGSYEAAVKGGGL